jgi:hypothetical protein
VCEDTLLAIPVMLDLVVLTELCTRIKIAEKPASEFILFTLLTIYRSSLFPRKSTIAEKFDLSKINFLPFHPLLGAVIGFLLKAPHFPSQVPVVNSLFKQRFIYLLLNNILFFFPE